MPRTTLSHYRVLEQLGAGGMGVVFRAHDERLQRDVALKVLPAGALQDDTARRRFRREALALSRLNHPNIETIHDFDTEDGTDFLVAEYIPGQGLDETLAAGPLPEKEVIRLGLQLSEGLAAAHDQGVIHRDLKPANLRVMPDGRLKILDFGLARMLPVGSGEQEIAATLSESSAIAGTAPYMAPEQLIGGRLDMRTDLWAAGVVLYEMATGRRPFAGAGPRLSDAILHATPEAPKATRSKISEGLQAVILQCLNKEPEERYLSARELALDLQRLSRGAAEKLIAAGRKRRGIPRLILAYACFAVILAVIVATIVNVGGIGDLVLGRASAPQIRSLAVLPLANLSNNPEQEYFADGLTESLITELSKIGALKVISRTSVMRYKKPDKPMRQIARDLGVDGLIEGSVLGEGDQVRITVQLIEGKSDRHLWAESYQREMRSILALQSEIARDISREIKAKVSSDEQARLVTTRSVDPQVHRLYLLGRYHWNKRSAKGLSAAIDYFQKAIAQDPTYAPAYGGLADCYAVMVTHSSARPSDVFPKAIAAATKALEFDETLADPHASLAYTKDVYEWDWAGAEREYKRALQLNPNDASTYHWHALHFAYMGQLEEAITEIKKAEELDPVSVIVTANEGMLLHFFRHDDEAVAELQKALEMDPNFILAHSTLGAVYTSQGRYDEAIAERKKAVELSKGFFGLAGLGRAYAQAGRRAEAEKIIKELQEQARRDYVHPSHLALIYIGLGDKDSAFAWLEKAYAEHSFLYFLKSDPNFDPLRSDPRFQDLLRRMNLPQ